MADSEISIRRLGVEDASALSAVAIKAYSDHYLHLWDDGSRWYLQTFFTPASFEAELRDPSALFFMIYYKDEAIGFLKLNVGKALPDGSSNALELERIYLRKEASGKGIGTRLLYFTFDVARQRGHDFVWLKVMDSSKSPIAFYERSGFEIIGAHQLSFAQMKKELRGMYIMQKKV